MPIRFEKIVFSPQTENVLFIYLKHISVQYNSEIKLFLLDWSTTFSIAYKMLIFVIFCCVLSTNDRGLYRYIKHVLSCLLCEITYDIMACACVTTNAPTNTRFIVAWSLQHAVVKPAIHTLRQICITGYYYVGKDENTSL